MRPAHALGVAALLLLAGCSLGGPGGGTGDARSLSLTEEWTAGTSAVQGNHHAVGAGRIGDEAVVAIPIGGYRGEGGCRLLVVDGEGRERWTAAIPPHACTIHAVADPTVADFVGDGEPEVLAATTQEQVVAHDPQNGSARFRYGLTDYGYTRPVVADVTGDAARELVVVDVAGTLSVVRPDGTAVWNRSLDAFAWSEPAVADLDGAEQSSAGSAAQPRDGDGGTEVAVGLGNGTAVAFDRRGDRSWATAVGDAITWTTRGDVDGDGVGEFVVATDGGTVAALDGRDGRVDWRRSLGSLAAVGGVADGDGDGEVYATAKDGRLRALAGTDGATEWSTPLTNASVQMTPPPVVGDVTGDGAPEVVAVTNDGYVRVVDPADGAVLASYRRDAPIYTHATLAQLDGGGGQEVLVMYGDGTAVALSVRSSAG